MIDRIKQWYTKWYIWCFGIQPGELARMQREEFDEFRITDYGRLEMTERDKVTVDDVIGLIQTDEPTNSVELKKEAYNMGEKSKKLCTIESCEYCPYFEKLKITKEVKENPLIDAEFYKCNKLQICVEVGKIYLKEPQSHLFKFCPLEEA